jgi:hypothetical protein
MVDKPAPSSSSTKMLLSKTNLQRSCRDAPLIRRSESSRIETWRDEVSHSSGESSSEDMNIKGGGEHAARRGGGLLGKLLLGKNRREAGGGGGVAGGDLVRTCMYDGCKESERVRDDWESGAGSSMYRGSVDSESGRLERAERLLNRGGQHGKQG